MQNKLRQLLLRGPATGKELYTAMGISQAKFSRLLSKSSEDIVVIGNHRNTRYALLRPIRNLPKQIPIYSITRDGQIVLLAKLTGIYPHGFYLESNHPEVFTTTYEDLPYWLVNMIPAGFLGRLIPKKYPELLYPEDIQLWGNDDIIHYWYTLGWDLIGNLIIGDLALKTYQQNLANPKFIESNNRAKAYEQKADDVINLGDAGSSAGGEQPKFLSIIKSEDYRPVIVKFIINSQSEVSNRWRDLLICEDLSLKLLAKNNILAANSELINSEKRTFLEVTRFDRLGLNGRLGIMSLAVIIQQFSGKTGSWLQITKDLLDLKIITNEIYQKIAILYYYGMLIRNSDMHQGNLSFIVNGEMILDISPVYDMLPMEYAPNGQELSTPKYSRVILPPQDRSYWEKSLELAKKFWISASENVAISPDFQKIINIEKNQLMKLA